MKIIGKIVKFTVKVGLIAGLIAFALERIEQKKEPKRAMFTDIMDHMKNT